MKQVLTKVKLFDQNLIISNKRPVFLFFTLFLLRASLKFCLFAWWRCECFDYFHFWRFLVYLLIASGNIKTPKNIPYIHLLFLSLSNRFPNLVQSLIFNWLSNLVYFPLHLSSLLWGPMVIHYAFYLWNVHWFHSISMLLMIHLNFRFCS